MNELLRARQDALQALKARADVLAAQNAHSDEEKAEIKGLPARMDAATAEIEEAKALSGRTAQATQYLDGNGAVSSIGAQPMIGTQQELLDTQAQIERARGIGLQMTGGERVGTELYRATRAGNLVAADSEGWGLSEKQFQAISEPRYAKAFDRLMRNKADKADYAVLSEGIDSGGGFLAPPEYIAEIIMRRPHPTSILNHVRTLPCSRDKVIFPRVNYDTDSGDIYTNGMRIQWIGENGPTPAVTDPVFGDVEVPIFTGQFPVEVSTNLIEDAAVPVAPVLQEFAQQAYNLGMDNVVVSGTGVTQPTGFLTNAGGSGLTVATTNIGDPVTADKLTGYVYGLPPQYSDSPNTVAVMNRMSAFATFAQIKDTSGQYIFGLARETGPEGMAVARKPVLFGYDVVFSAFMPNSGSGNKVVAFGDLRETYLLAMRMGLTVIPYGQQDKSMLAANKVGWFFKFRVGGMPVQPRAMKVGVQS